MRAHASTRERLPILDQFYETVFSRLPPVASVLDVACGLNPLALPWMPLAPGASYHAVDIYLDMMDFLGSFFAAAGVPGETYAADVIETPPQEAVDLALVLKAVPCLEQADRSAGEILLGSLQAKYILVSYPVHSLGGRSKGMAVNYENHFTALAASLGWSDYERLAFPSELAFLVRRGR
jgi:16S rRNA (guanine(1405)-N(7))-methyltransferase